MVATRDPFEVLVGELEALTDDLDGLTEAEFEDPAQFSDALVNNLPTIQYALSAGMPVTAWRPAVKNSGEVDRVLRAVRQWEETARRLLAMLAGGVISAEQFRERMVEAYTRHARNAFIAGRRGVGDLSALRTADFAQLMELTMPDVDRMNAYLTNPVVSGGLGSLIAAMVLDPTNYLGSGLPGDPFAGLPAPLGAGKKSIEKQAEEAIARMLKGRAPTPALVARAEKEAQRLVAHGRAVPEAVAKLAGRMLEDPANATAQLANFNKRVADYGDNIRSYSHAGEMAALTGALPADATLAWWTLGAADHCIDCVRLSDASPFYASMLENDGIFPGSGHTRCMGKCRCSIGYDVPAEVCTDPLSGSGSLGDLTESADGRRLNVWVQEAEGCSAPMSIDALSASLDAPAMLDDDEAFRWDEDLGGTITGDLDDYVMMGDILDVVQGVASRAVGKRVRTIVKGEADAFARQADWLRSVVPGDIRALRLSRFQAEGASYHTWWSETLDAIRFELGATTAGLPILDPDFTLRAMSDLAARAERTGRRLEVNGATASEGMKRWLDALGARQALYGGIPPTVLPDFRQGVSLADRLYRPLPGIAPETPPFVAVPAAATKADVEAHLQALVDRFGEPARVEWKPMTPAQEKQLAGGNGIGTSAGAVQTGQGPTGVIRVPEGLLDPREQAWQAKQAERYKAMNVGLKGGERPHVYVPGNASATVTHEYGHVILSRLEQIARTDPAFRDAIDATLKRIRKNPPSGRALDKLPTGLNAHPHTEAFAEAFALYVHGGGQDPYGIGPLLARLPQPAPKAGIAPEDPLALERARIMGLGQEETVLLTPDGRVLRNDPGSTTAADMSEEMKAAVGPGSTLLHNHPGVRDRSFSWQDLRVAAHSDIGTIEVVTGSGTIFRATPGPNGWMPARDVKDVWDNTQFRLTDELEARHLKGPEWSAAYGEMLTSVNDEAMRQLERDGYVNYTVIRSTPKAGTAPRAELEDAITRARGEPGTVTLDEDLRDVLQSIGQTPGGAGYHELTLGPPNGFTRNGGQRDSWGYVAYDGAGRPMVAMRMEGKPWVDPTAIEAVRVRDFDSAPATEAIPFAHPIDHDYAHQGWATRLYDYVQDSTPINLYPAVGKKLTAEGKTFVTHWLEHRRVMELPKAGIPPGGAPKPSKSGLEDAIKRVGAVEHAPRPIPPVAIPDPTIRSFIPPEVEALPGWPDAGRLKDAGPKAAKAMGGWAPKKLLRDPAGVEWLLKREAPDAEVGAANLGHALGLRMPGVRKVEWDGETWAMQPMVPDVTEIAALPSHAMVEQYVGHSKMYAAAMSDPQLTDMARMSVLDFVIANSDTHAGNWLIDKEGRLWGVDRGLGFRGAVASSANVETFWATSEQTVFSAANIWGNGLFGTAMVQPDAMGFFRRVNPRAIGEVLDRLDAMTPAEFERLIGDAVDLVAEPFGDRASRLASLLARKDAARKGFSDWFLRRVEAMPPSEVGPEWKAWLKAGGTFDMPAVVSVPAGPPAFAAKAMPAAVPLPSFYAATAKGSSLVGNDLGVWSKGFVPASDRPEVLERLATLLPNTKGNVLDGFSLGQLNTILNRTEVMSAAGIDMTLLKRLGDFTRVPDADRKLGIGLTYADRVALRHDWTWKFLNGVDSPDTVYNDIGGLFAHEYGHVLFNRLGFERQSDALALFERVKGSAGTDLSTYAKSDPEEWFGEVVAAITTPGYTPGTLPYDGEVWSLLASDGKALATGLDGLPAVSAKAPAMEKGPDLRKSIANGPYGEVTEMMPTAQVAKYSEFDRAEPLDAAAYKKLRSDIKAHGVKDPLQLEVSVADGTALLTEGNTRLAIARELGIEWVPVRGVRRNGSFSGAQAAKARPVKVTPDATGYVAADLRPSAFAPSGDFEMPAPPTEPIGPPIVLPKGKAPFFKPGEAQQYLVADSPLPLNSPLTDWTGYVPPEPPLPAQLLKPDPIATAQAKVARDAAYKGWEDIEAGRVNVAFSRSAVDDKKPLALGMVVEKVGNEWVVARSPSDLDALKVFIKDGGDTKSDAFWALMGYSPEDLDAIDAYEAIKGGLRLTGGVIIAEPDGRLWLLAPRNRFAGYENTHFKGGVDPGEQSAAVAAVREVREESGFSVELDSYLGDYVNTDQSGLTRFYIGHRTGGGPLWAHQKETYEVRLVTPDEAKGMLTRYGHPDARDQQVLADAVAALQGSPSTPHHLIPTDALAELAAKTQPPEQASVWYPPPKKWGGGPKVGIAPDPTMGAAFGYDHAALKTYTPGPITPPGTHFPMYQSHWKLPDGTKQPFYWQLKPTPQATKPDASMLFWANSKKQVENPHLRFTLHVAQMLKLGEQVASDPAIIGVSVNEALLVQVPKLRELLVAAGAIPFGKTLEIDRDAFLGLAHAIETNGPLPKGTAYVPTASFPPVPVVQGLSGVDPEDLLALLNGSTYLKPANSAVGELNAVAWTIPGGKHLSTFWTVDGDAVKVFAPLDLSTHEQGYKVLFAGQLAHHIAVAKELELGSIHLGTDWFAGAKAKWAEEVLGTPLPTSAAAYGYVLHYGDMTNFAGKVEGDLAGTGANVPDLLDFHIKVEPPATTAQGGAFDSLFVAVPYSEVHAVPQPNGVFVQTAAHPVLIKWSGGAERELTFVATIPKAEMQPAIAAALVHMADRVDIGTLDLDAVLIPSKHLSADFATMLHDDFNATWVDGGMSLRVAHADLMSFRYALQQEFPFDTPSFYGAIGDYVDLATANAAMGDIHHQALSVGADGGHLFPFTLGGYSVKYSGGTVDQPLTVWHEMKQTGSASVETMEAQVATLRYLIGEMDSSGGARLIIEPTLEDPLRDYLFAHGAEWKAGSVVLEREDALKVWELLEPPVVFEPPLPPIAASLPEAVLTPVSANSMLDLFAGVTETKTINPLNGATMNVSHYGDQSVTWRRYGNTLEVWELDAKGGAVNWTDEAFRAHILRMGAVMDASPKVDALRFHPYATTDVLHLTLSQGQQADLLGAGAKTYAGGIRLTRAQTLALRDKYVAEVKTLTATPGHAKPAGTPLYDASQVASFAPAGFDTLTVSYASDIVPLFGQAEVDKYLSPNGNGNVLGYGVKGSQTTTLWHLTNTPDGSSLIHFDAMLGQHDGSLQDFLAMMGAQLSEGLEPGVDKSFVIEAKLLDQLPVLKSLLRAYTTPNGAVLEANHEQAMALYAVLASGKPIGKVSKAAVNAVPVAVPTPIHDLLGMKPEWTANLTLNIVPLKQGFEKALYTTPAGSIVTIRQRNLSDTVVWQQLGGSPDFILRTQATLRHSIRVGEQFDAKPELKQVRFENLDQLPKFHDLITQHGGYDQGALTLIGRDDFLTLRDKLAIEMGMGDAHAALSAVPATGVSGPPLTFVEAVGGNPEHVKYLIKQGPTYGGAFGALDPSWPLNWANGSTTFVKAVKGDYFIEGISGVGDKAHEALLATIWKQGQTGGINNLTLQPGVFQGMHGKALFDAFDHAGAILSGSDTVILSASGAKAVAAAIEDGTALPWLGPTTPAAMLRPPATVLPPATGKLSAQLGYTPLLNVTATFNSDDWTSLYGNHYYSTWTAVKMTHASGVTDLGVSSMHIQLESAVPPAPSAATVGYLSAITDFLSSGPKAAANLSVPKGAQPEIDAVMQAVGALSSTKAMAPIWVLNVGAAQDLVSHFLNDVPFGKLVTGSAVAAPLPVPKDPIALIGLGNVDDATVYFGTTTIVDAGWHDIGGWSMETSKGWGSEPVVWSAIMSTVGGPVTGNNALAASLAELHGIGQWAVPGKGLKVWGSPLTQPGVNDLLKAYGAVPTPGAVQASLSLTPEQFKTLTADLDALVPVVPVAPQVLPTGGYVGVPNVPVAPVVPTGGLAVAGDLYGFSNVVLHALGEPTEFVQAQGFVKYMWPGVGSASAKFRASSTSLTLVSVSGAEEFISTVMKFGERMDTTNSISQVRIAAKALPSGEQGPLFELLALHGVTHVGDNLVMDRAAFLDMRDYLAYDLNIPVGGVTPTPPTILNVPPPPKPPNLGDLYGFDHEAASLAWHDAYDTVINETPLTRVVETKFPDGTKVRWAEELQGQARIIRVRSVTTQTAFSAAGLAAMVGHIQALAMAFDTPGTSAFTKGQPVRLLIDKKVTDAMPGLAKMFGDSTLPGYNSMWKETKSYWVIGGHYFDYNFGADVNPLAMFAADLATGTPKWLPVSAIPVNVAPGPVKPVAPTLATTVPVGPGLIGGVTVAPAQLSPSFLYDYNAAVVAGTKPIETGDKTMFGGAERQVLAVGPIKGYYSVSPSGARIGLFGMDVPAGTDQHDLSNAAYAMLLDMAQRGTATTKGFFIKPDFYESVPGLRQLILDAGGEEAQWANLGEAVKMTPAQSQNLVNVLMSNTMAGVKPGFQSASDFLGFDPVVGKVLFGTYPKVTKTDAMWTIGKVQVAASTSLDKAGHGVIAFVQGDKVQAPLVAVAQLNYLAEQGATSIDVAKRTLESVPGLRQFLLSVGGEVRGGVVYLDEGAVGEMRRYLTKDALPVALGGKALPYSVLDALAANLDSTIEAITKHTIQTGGLETVSRFIVGNSAVSMRYTRSSRNIHWTAVDRKTGNASVGEGRAATAAQLRAFANEIAQHGGIERLDVSEAILKDNPGLATVLRRYKGQMVKATDTQDAYISLSREQVLKLRKDLEAEFAQLGATTGANEVEQWAGIVAWPTVEDLKPVSKTLKGQTPKAVFADGAGNEWLFKPGASGRGATTDMATAELARLLGLPVPPVRRYSLEVNGKVVEGSLQKMLGGAHGIGATGIKDITALTPAQTEDLLRHSVLDWLVNNDDAHVDNWLIGVDGRLWSIDKTRSYTTWKTAHDVLDNGAMGNGFKPQMFEWWTRAQQDPTLLKKVHPSSVTATLRTLEKMTDAEFERIVRPIAEATQDRRFVGKADQFVAEMLARKRSTATDIAAYFKKNVDAMVRANPSAVPDEWKAWAKGGGVFNLNATAEDLWREDWQALDAKFGAWSPSAYQAILSKGHFSQSTSIIHQFVGAGLGSYASDPRVKGLAAYGYSPHYIPLLIPPQQYVEWLEVQRWAMYHILNGGAPVQHSSEVASLRKFFNPKTGTLRLVRGSSHFSSPKSGMLDWEKRGARTFSSSYDQPPWGNIHYYFEIPVGQIISTPFTDIGSTGEREVTVRDVRPDQVFRAMQGNMGATAQLAYNGPVISGGP